MSKLSQFFGGGGGSIPTEIVVVNGGNGASCLCGVIAPAQTPTLTTCTYYIQGRGGSVAAAFFDISPGVTCPITVGAGGNSNCKVFSLSTPNPPYVGGGSISCCRRYGGSGCASKFGDFGGVDRPQPATLCGVDIPYGANYAQVAGKTSFSNFDTCRLSTFCGVDGTTFGGSIGCPYAGIRYMTGHGGGICNSLTKSVGAIAGCSTDLYGSKGYVSKITGTVKTYGSAKDMSAGASGGPYGAPISGFSGLVAACSLAHPDSSGPGSGHGAYFCTNTGCTIAAEPGTVIIQYPDDFNAATTSSPSVCDCSPATPGFRTYRFLCPGSITFP